MPSKEMSGSDYLYTISHAVLCMQKAEKAEPKDEKMADADAPTEAPADPEAAAEAAAASESEPMDSSS